MNPYISAPKNLLYFSLLVSLLSVQVSNPFFLIVQKPAFPYA